MTTDLVDLLTTQLQLQAEKMKDGDPRNLSDEERAKFFTWNAFALDDEIHEAMQEVGWKPWATSRHLNHEAFMKEMVDAFHFFMNMLLAGSPGMTPQGIATKFCQMYFAKNAENARRQDTGYDGVKDKCPTCRRELATTGVWKSSDDEEFCSAQCWVDSRTRRTVS